MKDNAFEVLTTPYETEHVDIPYTEYPRPSLKRDSYFTLNGRWDLTVNRKEKNVYSGAIKVPFVPESKVSGVFRSFESGDVLCYKRSFTLPEDFLKDRVIIHFGAVDRYAVVKVNGSEVCRHRGGYLPFDADITDALCGGENILEVEVVDDLSSEYSYGKQRKKRGGMWYTPISGIWQSVWLESVCDGYIKKLKIYSDLSSVRIESEGGVEQKRIVLHADGGDREYTYSGDSTVIEIDHPRLWTPDTPNLYYFTLYCGEDKIDSYFALRRISIEKRKNGSFICLNEKPVFLHGLLDQGYFSDGIYLPATPKGYRDDILTAKRLGFNTLRKHIKIEPELFYYYCDLYGMIVCQDMLNSGKYNFLIDTALPTVGLKKGISHSASKLRRENFEREMRETVELLHNHPSVCYYTIFNEGWGQYDADRLYTEMKALDPTRVWDATSGWFREKQSDVYSEHVYFKPINIRTDKARPVILSEFGGYSYKVSGHSFNLKKTYGYKLFSDREEFCKAMKELYIGQILFAISEGLGGCILTQLSDVEDETNGLITYDRQVVKVDEELFLDIACQIKKHFADVSGDK